MTEFAAETRRLMGERGLSVRGLARAASYDPGYLCRVLAGRQCVSVALAARLDQVLDAGGMLVALGPGTRHVPEGNQVRDNAGEPEMIRVPCRTPDGRIVFVTIRRRTFLQRAGVTAFAALGVPPARLADTGPPAARFLAARETLMNLDNISGPRDAIPLAVRQVGAMHRLWQSLSGRDLHDLMLVQVQFADLIGWLHQDCGDYHQARHWLDRALEWAHVAGDADSVTFVLARKCQLAGDSRNSADAIATGEAAIRHAGSGNRLGAVAATYASYGYALADDRGACDRLCEQSRGVLDATGDDGRPWARFFDTAYINVHHARSLAVLGDCRTAAHQFRTAIDSLQPSYYRDRGVYLAREATAYAGAGEAEHAAGLGGQALAIGTETGSGRIFAELADLERALNPASSSPAVSQFRAAMDAAILRPA